tara:strand:+ start:16896 stop:17375 length:480 start_codon:yes stop_codon:yes gene_type:complete
MPFFYIIEPDGLVKAITECYDDTVLDIDSRYTPISTITAIDAEAAADPHSALDKIYLDGVLSPAPEPEPEPARETSIYSVNEYKTLFTLAEKGALYGSEDPIARALIDEMNTATYIDTADPRTIAGVDYLISAGIVDASRRSEILRTHPEGEVVYPPAE